MKDYYRILGLENNASLSDIKKAYRRLAVKFHPDKNLDDDGFFDKMFKDITEAYDVLSNTEKRNEYDINSSHKENQKSNEYQKNSYDENSKDESQPNWDQKDDHVYEDETIADENNQNAIINWLIGINVLSFIVIGLNSNSLMERRTVQELIEFGGLAYDTFDTGELWRLITSQFIHLDIRHLLLNMYILYSIGGSLCAFINNKRFLSVYLMTGTIAAIVSLIFGNYTVSVGASGAIFGIIGYYLSLLKQFKQKKIFGENNDLLHDEIRSVTIFIVINLVIGFMSSIVDNGAHIGGLISGYLIGLTYEYQEERDTTGDVSQSDSLAGIGGWLFVFLVWMIIMGAGAIFTVIYTFNGGIGNLDQDIVGGLLDSYTIKEIISYKKFTLYYNVAIIIDIFFVLGYITLFFTKHRHFIYLFSLEMIYCVIFESFFYYNNLQNVELIPFLAVNLSVLIAFNLYFHNSKRVMNTFIH